jgi:hypothetical protein
MRDPTRSVDPNIEAAIQEARQLLRCYVPLGLAAPEEPSAAKQHREASNYVQGSQDIPESIRDHLLKLLAREKRAKRTCYIANRNFWLALTVERIREFGFEATRSSYTRPDRGEKLSASRIVQISLKEFGLNLRERTIEDAWTDYRNRLPFRAVPLKTHRRPTEQTP